MIRVSAFSRFESTGQRVIVQDGVRARLLPRCCGTYAFHDHCGDLLYIGKAKNVRTRVLSHLRDHDSRYLLPAWSRRIARIEARPAGSELEALLVEADLVGRLRPAFNRQMRSWQRYCYLVATGDPGSPLTISTQLPSWRRCFGPFRSRRQAVDIIESVFRLLNGGEHGDMTLDQMYTALSGLDHSVIVRLEQGCEISAETEQNDSRAGMQRQIAANLRKAFERAALLRTAEELLGAIIVLPGTEERRTCAVVNNDGLELGCIGEGIVGVKAFLQWYAGSIASMRPHEDRRLSKSVCDCLCVAARHVASPTSACRFLSRREACELSPGDFLEFLESPAPDHRASRS